MSGLDMCVNAINMTVTIAVALFMARSQTFGYYIY
jgi:hypothetical protein